MENCKRCDSLEEQIQTIEDMIEIQSRHGTYDFDAYMHGMANGMIYIHSILTGQKPQYLETPKEWLRDKPESLELVQDFGPDGEPENS